MKKAIIILISLGFVFVGAAFYFSEGSIKLHRTEFDVDPYEEHNQVISNLEYRLDVLEAFQNESEDLSYYEYLELDGIDYIAVNDCVQKYFEIKEIGDDCKEIIIDVIIENSSEIDFIESIIGYSINYVQLSMDVYFPYKLFENNTPLHSKIVLSFLNRYRDPIKLQSGFKAYKEHFYQRFPKQFYYKMFDDTVLGLINAYDDIESKTDKEAFFEEVYFIAGSQDRLGEYWNITFWKRRSLENNDIVIYNIINNPRGKPTRYSMEKSLF